MPNAAFVPFFEHVEASQAAAAQKSFVPVTPAMPPAVAPVAAVRPAGHVAHAPTINLERDGDRIRMIRIECSCGQIIELNCIY